MILWLDDDLFAAKVADVDLVTLLRQAAMRRHTLVISDDPNAMWSKMHPAFTLWRSGLPARLGREVDHLCECLRHVASNMITRGRARPLWITQRDFEFKHAQQCQLKMDDAVRAVALPLYVLLENQINDAAFLRRVMPPLWRNKLAYWERQGELRYMQGGGITELAKMIDFHTDDQRSRQVFGLPAKVWQLLHFVIHDHDGIHTSQLGEGAVKVAKAINAADMAAHSHCLWRRAQENYLPHIILETIAKFRLTDDSSRTQMLEDIAQYFSQAKEIQQFGVLPRIKDSKAPYFKGEFARYENHEMWRDEHFEADGVWPEMTILAEAIAAAM